MMTSVKEIKKEFALAKKHFNRAIELAKKSIIVGEINFPRGEKKTVKERLKRLAKDTPGQEEKDLPDLDKGGYMKKRGE